MDIRHTYTFNHAPEAVYALYSSETFVRQRFRSSGLVNFTLRSEELEDGRLLVAVLPVTESLGKARWAVRAMGLSHLELDYRIKWCRPHPSSDIIAHYRYAPRQLNAAIAGRLVLTSGKTEPTQRTQLVHSAALESPHEGASIRWLTKWILKRVQTEFDADMAALETALRAESPG